MTIDDSQFFDFLLFCHPSRSNSMWLSSLFSKWLYCYRLWAMTDSQAPTHALHSLNSKSQCLPYNTTAMSDLIWGRQQMRSQHFWLPFASCPPRVVRWCQGCTAVSCPRWSCLHNLQIMVDFDGLTWVNACLSSPLHLQRSPIPSMWLQVHMQAIPCQPCHFSIKLSLRRLTQRIAWLDRLAKSYTSFVSYLFYPGWKSSIKYRTSCLLNLASWSEGVKHPSPIQSWTRIYS